MPEWLTSWLQSVNVWDAVLAVAGVAALVQFIRKKAWRGLIAFARGIVRLDRVIDTVLRLPEQIEQIHHETHHNNGGSIKDSTVRTEQKVDHLVTLVDQLIAWRDEQIVWRDGHEEMSTEIVSRVKQLEDTQPKRPKE